MTPGARVAAAIGVLDAWLAGTPAERALTTWARGARYAGSKDRAAVRDHVYDVLRRRGNCEAMGGRTGRGLMLGLLRLQGIAPETVFTGMGHAPEALSPEEGTAPHAAEDPWRDLPEWLHATLRADLGSQADAVVGAMRERAPLWLRVNLRRGTRDEAARRLAAEGVETRPSPLCETALEVIAGARTLRRAPAFLDGLVEPQDLSPQMACAAVDWPQGGRILDHCAGGGGKTLAIADRSDAAVFAHDANPRRLSGLHDRAARAGISYATLASEDLPCHAPYDLVLCDVPCSGSGTWRRDPEGKWRLSRESLDDLCRVQRRILEDVRGLVAPGGQLVYMTCSLLRAENEAVIDGFTRDSGWPVRQMRRYTSETASDGFFLATLQCPA